MRRKIKFQILQAVHFSSITRGDAFPVIRRFPVEKNKCRGHCENFCNSIRLHCDTTTAMTFNQSTGNGQASVEQPFQGNANSLQDLRWTTSIHAHRSSLSNWGELSIQCTLIAIRRPSQGHQLQRPTSARRGCHATCWTTFVTHTSTELDSIIVFELLGHVGSKSPARPIEFNYSQSLIAVRYRLLFVHLSSSHPPRSRDGHHSFVSFFWASITHFPCLDLMSTWDCGGHWIPGTKKISNWIAVSANLTLNATNGIIKSQWPTQPILRTWSRNQLNNSPFH